MGGACGTYGKDNIAYRVVWSRVQAMYQWSTWGLETDMEGVNWSLGTDTEGVNWTDVAWGKEKCGLL